MDNPKYYPYTKEKAIEIVKIYYGYNTNKAKAVLEEYESYRDYNIPNILDSMMYGLTQRGVYL